MKITELEVMQGFIQLCEDGWQQGWHERNGGNLSYRPTPDEIEACRPFFNKTPGNWVEMDIQADNLRNSFFIVTGSGKFMKNVQSAPQDNICIIELNDTGDSYRIVWGLEKGGRPTSELSSHIMNLSARMKVTNNACRVIYHAHPANIIAMTFTLPLTNRDFSRALWRSMTECVIIFPGGVGVVPWMVPGGRKIALATCKLMEDFNAVIWAHHGVFVSGEDFDTSFGLMHTIEKSAQIYNLVKSSGDPVLQTITDEGLRMIATEYHVTIREDFLD